MQKPIKSSLKLGLVAGFLLMSFCLSLGYAQHIPHLIRYKGNIKELLKEKEIKKEDAKEEKKEEKEEDGKTYSLTFRIYNLETGGEALWIETHPEVIVEKQEFEVLLGSIAPLDLKFSEDYWLSIEIDNQGEIEPRERMTSVGYAYMADDSYKLGGRYSEEYAFSQHSHLGEDVVTPVAEAVNADTVDGLHADQLGGIKDHGLLEGLSDDDHLQYLNILRGDERYAGVGWDGLTKLKTAQDHIADKNNPHSVTLEQLGHLDNNPEEEAPTLTERGEPTGTEIQQWADDIMSWGHSNLVANLNADKLDGKDSTEFSLLGHFHTLMDLTDVTSELRAAFLAAGTAGASGSNRLATMTDIGSVSGLWTDKGTYIYPNNIGSGFQIRDTGNLIVNGKVGIGMENPSRLLQVGSNSHSSGQGILVDGVLSLSWGEVGIPTPEIGLVSLWHEKNSPSAGYLGMKFFNGEVPFVVTSDGNVGIGTTNPQSPLHVANAKVSLNLQDIEHLGSDPGYGSYIRFTDSAGETVAYVGDGGSSMLMQFRTMPGYRLAFGSGQNYQLVLEPSGYVGIGKANPQATLDVNGDLSVNGPIYQRGSLLHADYVFEPDYKLESIEEHSNFMWQEKHLKAVPKATKLEDGQEIVEVGARNKGVLEELEKAHIYIAQLNERLKQLESKLAGETADAR